MLAGSYDVVVLGSGIAGLAAALAAHECGLAPVLVEKADKLGGTTCDSYGLISSKIEQDRITAELKDGVMTLVLPKAEKAKPRRITVN